MRRPSDMPGEERSGLGRVATRRARPSLQHPRRGRASPFTLQARWRARGVSAPMRPPSAGMPCGGYAAKDGGGGSGSTHIVCNQRAPKRSTIQARGPAAFLRCGRTDARPLQDAPRKAGARSRKCPKSPGPQRPQTRVAMQASRPEACLRWIRTHAPKPGGAGPPVGRVPLRGAPRKAGGRRSCDCQQCLRVQGRRGARCHTPAGPDGVSAPMRPPSAGRGPLRQVPRKAAGPVRGLPTKPRSAGGPKRTHCVALQAQGHRRRADLLPGIGMAAPGCRSRGRDCRGCSQQAVPAGRDHPCMQCGPRSGRNDPGPAPVGGTGLGPVRHRAPDCRAIPVTATVTASAIGPVRAARLQVPPRRSCATAPPVPRPRAIARGHAQRDENPVRGRGRAGGPRLPPGRNRCPLGETAALRAKPLPPGPPLAKPLPPGRNRRPPGRNRAPQGG